MKLSGEWELTPEELSGLFEAKNWRYHTAEGLVIPNARGIETMLAHLVDEVLTRNVDEAQGGRFMILKDPDLPNSYNLWLNAGSIWDDDALSEDGREILGLDERGDEDDG